MDVPRDISVVGFDDTPTATTVWPELTTIRQPIAAMAASSIDLLLRNIRRRKDGEARVVVDHVVAHVLVKRDSVRAPISPADSAPRQRCSVPANHRRTGASARA